MYEYSPSSDNDQHNDNNDDGEHKYVLKLANAMKARLQYARLKVSSGMTNKNFQQVEEAMAAHDHCLPTPTNEKEDNVGEQEEAAARTIMLLSSDRGGETNHMPICVPSDYSPTYYKISHREEGPMYHHQTTAYPPSLFDVVASDQSYFQKSEQVGRQLPRLSKDHKHRNLHSNHRHPLHSNLPSRKTNHPIVYGKDPFHSTPLNEKYTAPRRGRPRKTQTETT